MIDRSISILVVEDDKATSQEIMSVLGGSYQCTFVRTEAEGEALIAGSAFNLVVVSLELTEDSGRKLFSVVRKNSQFTHIIAMSPPNDIHAQAAAMKHGALYIVEKPIKADRLLVLIKSALRSYELIRSRSAGSDESSLANAVSANRRVA